MYRRGGRLVTTSGLQLPVYALPVGETEYIVWTRQTECVQFPRFRFRHFRFSTSGWPSFSRCFRFPYFVLLLACLLGITRVFNDYCMLGQCWNLSHRLLHGEIFFSATELPVDPILIQPYRLPQSYQKLYLEVSSFIQQRLMSQYVQTLLLAPPTGSTISDQNFFSILLFSKLAHSRHVIA